MLEAGLFLDPAWDVLLDLFASEAEGRMISVSSACIASGVPTSTALDWIRKLEGSGLIYRERDPLDGRRTFLRMTRPAAEAVERWLNATFLH
jgi:DNA-binding MarR family transcriptional regulator